MRRPHPGPKVVAVHPHVDMYGSDRMFLESVTAMGPDVLVVVPKNGPLVEALEQRSMVHQVKDFPVLRRIELRTPWRALLFLIGFLRAAITLAAWLRAQDVAVVYVSTIAAPEWLIAGRLSGARVVCHVHESESHMSRLASALLLSPLRAAHQVIANSQDCLAWIKASLGARPARRIRVIHNGVREPVGAEVRPSGPGRGAKSLVVVGRLSARKGQDTAIAAAALVMRAGFDVTLTLVGNGYPGYESHVDGLHALAAQEGVSDITRFVGFRDPTPYVADADVVLVPSRGESFGLVAVEALLLGRPVVATRVGALPEVLRDGVTAILVPPDDPQAMADAVVHLLSRPDVATALGRAGKADARARFSMDAYRARLSEVVLPPA